MGTILNYIFMAVALFFGCFLTWGTLKEYKGSFVLGSGIIAITGILAVCFGWPIPYGFFAASVAVFFLNPFGWKDEKAEAEYKAKRKAEQEKYKKEHPVASPTERQLQEWRLFDYTHYFTR